MKDGEICIFYIPRKDDVYAVRCECYESYLDGKLAYGCSWYKGEKEILHAGRAEKIDTLEKARESIESTIKLRETLLSEGRK